MAKTKKTATAKKPTAKKPAAKAASPKKQAAKAMAKKATPKVTKPKKPAPKATSKAKPAIPKITRGKAATTKALAGARRPPNNPDVTPEAFEGLFNAFNDIKEALEEFAQHLRALDRMRLNGVGIKKLGFINRAYELADENPEFLPHYLTMDKFTTDFEYFTNVRALFDIGKQNQEILWNIIIQASDILYTDALEYYASVREAAKRRVDAAESLHNILSVFFKRKRSEGAGETEKELERDAKAIIRGKKDGRMLLENIKPKLTGGKHKVIDETYKDTARFKDTEEGEIKE